MESESPINISASFERHSLFNQIDRYETLTDKTGYIHSVLREHYPFIDRIAVAKYEERCKLLKTYVSSTDGATPLSFYQVRLDDVPSLQRIMERREARVMNDLSELADSPSLHSRRLLESGFRASYTVPLHHDDSFVGFVFFNSRDAGVFSESNLAHFDMVARLMAMLIGLEISQVATLCGALKTTTMMSKHRDPETGRHLERMASYARLIARELAPDHGLDDEFVEDVFLFAPLHDIGKIAIPDSILLKPGKLDTDEFEIMKTHTTKGAEITYAVLENFNIRSVKNMQMVSNITTYHHENIDGSGYPAGLSGERIPLEARIVAVADVFDALTSERPYKKAWSNEEAFTELQLLAQWKLDKTCVEALMRNQETIEEIQHCFRD